MLVYGDAVRHETAADKLLRLRALLERVAGLESGVERHGAIVAALIEAGELAQGVADEHYRSAGECDIGSPAERVCMALTMALAQCCAESWSSRFDDTGRLPFAEVERCAACVPSGLLEVKQPEGYAFYAVYPETFFAAAHALGLRRWQVFGVRSIGTSLACMVAAGLEAPQPTTLRPGGHPFDRCVTTKDLHADPAMDGYAIVDEGPGLSGSSMTALARWLLDQGIAQEVIHWFPSHANGPGPQASARTQELWRNAHVHVATFDDVVLDAASPEHRLERWVADVVGPLDAPLLDIGNGRWRNLQRRDAQDTPPAHPWQERRKFVATSDGVRWLVKFAGLGRYGMTKFARGQVLADGGFTPEPVALCHGFIIERWRDDLSPLPRWMNGVVRLRLLERIGDYLAFRARSFPADARSGASIGQLHAMARHNTEQALGSTLATTWDACESELAALASRMRRVETDNRMHAWEWLASDTAVVKTDALDHHAGHDLVGCQDIAWDIAGAAIEFDLSRDERDALSDRVSRQMRHRVDEPLLRFLIPCYLAFQLGFHYEAHAASTDAQETARLAATVDRYSRALREALEGGSFVP
jgi:hypothetical protein